MTLRPSIQRIARSSTANLSAIGAAGGPSAALGAFLSDMAGTMIDTANQETAQKVAGAAYAAGADQGRQAAADGTALALPEDDGTVRNQALKQGAMAGWLARFDVDSQTKAETWAAEHADDPEAFRAKWDGLTAGTVKMVPAELRPQVQSELDRRGGLTLARIQAAKTHADHQKLEENQNASILEAQLLADRNSENAWRSGAVSEAQSQDAKYLAYLDSRTDLDAGAKVVARDKFLSSRQRAAALGEFDRVKARGLSAAETFIKDFRKPGRHPQLDPDAVEGIAAEMERAAADLRERRRLAVAELRDKAQDAIFRAERGYGGADLDALAAQARALGAADLAGTLAETGRNAQLATDLARMPLPELQARVADYDAAAQAATDGASVRRADLARGVLAAAVKGIKADAMEHFRHQGADVPAIDWDKPETLSARAKAADLLSGVNGIPVPVLTKADTDDLTARMEQLGYEGRAQILGNLYRGLGPRRFPEVLDVLKEKSPEAAHAGALMAEGEAGQKAARDVLFGADLRRTVAKDGSAAGRQYMPPKDDAFKAAFQRELPADVVSGLTPGDLDGLQQAVVSAYVAKSHAAGLAKQDTLNITVFRKAVAEVTGGVLEWNGKPLIAPLRGMGQDDLDAVMAGLTDADLGGAQSLDGHPVTADQLRKYGALRMAEPGKYLVQVNGQYLVSPDHRPAVLDLGMLAGRR